MQSQVRPPQAARARQAPPPAPPGWRGLARGRGASPVCLAGGHSAFREDLERTRIFRGNGAASKPSPFLTLLRKRFSDPWCSPPPGCPCGLDGHTAVLHPSDWPKRQALLGFPHPAKGSQVAWPTPKPPPQAFSSSCWATNIGLQRGGFNASNSLETASWIHELQ